MEKIETKNQLFAITNYLIQKHKITEPVKLQKILYFLYLEYLKETRGKLFDEEFEAWIYGPVLRTVYNHLKYNGLLFNEYETFNDNGAVLVKICPLEKEITNFIDEKIQKYKSKKTFDLVDEAHKTSPWIKARKGLQEDELSTKKLKFSDMEKFVKTWKP